MCKSNCYETRVIPMLVEQLPGRQRRGGLCGAELSLPYDRLSRDILYVYGTSYEYLHYIGFIWNYGDILPGFILMEAYTCDKNALFDRIIP
ncbi:hypothetical protein J6590_075685 [Homalodisca vitripennis]|nr:hypothetical protein J6590_075685 [Homalodisca vitripennis]